MPLTKAGSGRVPRTAANSGTAYTVTAPSHGESRLALTLTGNAVLTLSGGTSGEVCSVQLDLIQDATGSRTVTWPGNIDWGTAGAPTLSTATGKTERVYLTTDDGGLSWQGATAQFGLTSPTTPSAPTSPAAADDGTGAIDVTWVQGAANGSTVTQNEIWRGTSSGSETLLATVSAGTSYHDAATSNGTTYYYKIKAINAVGTSAFSSEVSAVSGLVTIAADPFTAADSATAISGGRSTPTGSKAWTVGSAANWGISSNKAYKSQAAASEVFVDAGVADCTVQCDFTPPTTAIDSGLTVRRADANNYIDIIGYQGIGWYLQKKVGGANTNVGNWNGSPPVAGTPYTVKVVMSGSSVDVYIDGTLRISGTISDAALLAATKHGLWQQANEATSRWDNFQITTP